MKKVIGFILMCAVLFSLAACGGESNILESDENKDVGTVETDVLIPNDNYVIYKETATKTGVVLLYEYNDKRLVTKISHIKPDGQSEDEIYDYTYNADGSYSVHKTGWGNEYIQKYDVKGRLFEEINSPDSRSQKTYTYVYGDDNTVKYEERDENGYVQNTETRYYNDIGLLEKVEHFLTNGELFAYTEYSYDKYGNETTHIQYTPQGEKNSNNAVYAWTMEFDEYDRLVKKEKRQDGGFDGLAHKEIYAYDDTANIYTVTSETGLYVREYRPLSECIK